MNRRLRGRRVCLLIQWKFSTDFSEAAVTFYNDLSRIDGIACFLERMSDAYSLNDGAEMLMGNI